MKFLKYAFSLLFVASLVLLTSCGGDDPKPKTKKEMLTAVTWKITKLKVDGQEGVPEDCDKDDEFTFEADQDYKEVENTKCEVDDPATTSGTWAFKTDEKFIAVSFTDPSSGFSITIDKEIVTLTETSLVVKYVIFGIAVEETYSPK